MKSDVPSDKDVAPGARQSKLDFILVGPAPIAIIVLGWQLGGFVGYCMTLPLAVATSAIASLIVTKARTGWRKGGALFLLYLVGGAITWMALGVLLPAIRSSLGLV